MLLNGIREGHTRPSLERADPATLNRADSIDLRMDFRVVKA